jgi:hypothetical protein
LSAPIALSLTPAPPPDLLPTAPCTSLVGGCSLPLSSSLLRRCRHESLLPPAATRARPERCCGFVVVLVCTSAGGMRPGRPMTQRTSTFGPSGVNCFRAARLCDLFQLRCNGLCLLVAVTLRLIGLGNWPECRVFWRVPRSRVQHRPPLASSVALMQSCQRSQLLTHILRPGGEAD